MTILYFRTRRDAYKKLAELKSLNPQTDARFIDQGVFYGSINKRWAIKFTETSIPTAIESVPLDQALVRLKTKAQQAADTSKSIDKPVVIPVSVNAHKNQEDKKELNWSVGSNYITIVDENGVTHHADDKHPMFQQAQEYIFTKRDIESALNLIKSKTLHIKEGLIYFGNDLVDVFSIIRNANPQQLESLEIALGLHQ